MKNVLQLCATIKRKHMADTVKKIRLSEEDVSNVFRLPPDERRKAQVDIVENMGLSVGPNESPLTAYIKHLQMRFGFNRSNDIQPELWGIIQNDSDSRRLTCILS